MMFLLFRLRVLLCLAAPVLLSGQNAPAPAKKPADVPNRGDAKVASEKKAPPAREKALRAAVKKFADAFIAGKYRDAYLLVADDSQDHFMTMNKPQYKGYAVKNIEWADNFTKARITADVDTEFKFAGNVLPVKRELTSDWRLAGQRWEWYYVPLDYVDTPFGRVPVTPGDSKSINVREEIKKGPNAETLGQGIEIVKPEATFSRKIPGEAEVEIRNGLPGYVTLKLVMAVYPGLKVHTLSQRAGPNETVKFKFVWSPPENPDSRDVVNGIVVASPLGHQYPISVRFEN